MITFLPFFVFIGSGISFRCRCQSDFALVHTHTYLPVSLHNIRVVTSSIDDPGNQLTLSPLQGAKN